MLKSLVFFFCVSLFPVFAEDTVYIPDKEKGLIVASESPIQSDPLEDFLPDNYESAFTRMIFTLIGVAALAILTFIVFRRMTAQKMKSGGGAERIHVLEKKVLSPKTMIYLIEVDQEKVLVAESHLDVKPLHSAKRKAFSLKEEKELV